MKVGGKTIVKTQRNEGLKAGAKAVLNKSGVWKSGSNTWNETRKWLGKQGFALPGEQVHHWAIRQRSFLGEMFPSLINQKWNLKPISNGAVKGADSLRGHMGIHGRGRVSLNPFESVFFGSPSWAKAVGASSVGHGISRYVPRTP